MSESTSNSGSDLPPDGDGSGLDLSEKHRRIYTGASGQMAVLSEFLYRLINVAVPEVDVGDDVFVVKERDETVTRVQVKHSKTEDRRDGSDVAQFSLPWEQFDREDVPALVYVLAVRNKNRWSDFLVVRRSVLRQLQADIGIGTLTKDDSGHPLALRLRLVLTADDVIGKNGVSFQKFRNAFEPWPPFNLRAETGMQPRLSISVSRARRRSCGFSLCNEGRGVDEDPLGARINESATSE